MLMEMNAAVLEEHQKLVYKKVPVQPLNKGEVRIAVAYCGICGTDQHIVYGGSLRYPLTPGHELTGVVVDAADEEGKNLIGKEVVAYGIVGCMECEFCKKGDYTKCQSYDFIGAGRDGAFAEYANYPARNVIPLDGISLKEGALVEPLAVTVHAVRRLTNGVPKLAVVVGAGPIGLLTAYTLKAFGAETTIILDVDDRKIELAHSMGFEHSMNPSKGSVKDKLASLGYTDGAPAIMECSGSVPGFNSAITMAAPGGSIVMVGMFGSDVLIKSDACRILLRKELNIAGSWISNHGPEASQTDWTLALELLRDGKVDTERIITGVVDLENVPETLDRLHSGADGGIKTIIKVAK